MAISITDLIPFARLEDLSAIARKSFANGNILQALWIFAALDKAYKTPIFAANTQICLAKLCVALQTDFYACAPQVGSALEDPDIARLACSLALAPSANATAIYTAQFGDYDSLHEPERKEANIDYLYFTDNPELRSDIFKIILIPKSGINPRLLARCFKTLPHIFLSDYKRTVWIDSSTFLRGQPVAPVLAKALSLHDIAIHVHKDRNCVYEECKECCLQNKDLKHNINAMEHILRTMNYPANNGLSETGQIFRNNTSDILILNELWWQFIKNVTVRDQLSLDFICHLLNIKKYALPDTQWSNNFARVYNHKSVIHFCDDISIEIIILVHNHPDITLTCIDSLMSKTKHANFHISIVDNASDIETKAVLASLKQKYPSKIVIIINNKNKSFSQANNDALSHSDSKYVLFLNNDIEIIDENWLASMVFNIESNKSIGAIAPVLINSDYTVQSCGIYLTFDHNKFVLPASHYKHFINNNYIHAVSGACLLSRRTIIASLCGFDEQFIYGQEDIDLCLRIKEKGYIIAIDTQTEVIHRESSTRMASPQTYINRELFHNKWDTRIEPLKLRVKDAK